MRQRKEIVAMLLAGGQGSRLGLLTEHIAKPAVPFGGKYRIIDFSLSNCIHSGIDTVGVLTQYKPMKLNSYIGIGSDWDLDRGGGGLFLLPPYVQQNGGRWYRGTADAICQNMDFIDQFEPQYVLVISGDHIYKMDYSLMLEYHKEKNADATISVIQVPWEEAHRFGIMAAKDDGKIYEFAEKPTDPRSNLASMGIYIFNWSVLKEYLIADQQDTRSDNDFGKNIIPKMLNNSREMYAYSFNGYWKDVGTIESYFSANMDLLNEKTQLNIFDNQLKTYSVNTIQPPHMIGPQAEIHNCLIGKGCQIFGTVEHSIISHGVYIGPGAVVKEAIIMPHAKIGEQAYVEKAIIGEDAIIGNYSRVDAKNFETEQCGGVENDSGIAVIGYNVFFSN